MRNKYTEPNIACIIGLYKQGRVKMSDKHLKRLQRRLSRLQKRYTRFENNKLIKSMDVIWIDEISCVDGVIVDRKPILNKPIQMTENIIWYDKGISDNDLKHNKFS